MRGTDEASRRDWLHNTMDTVKGAGEATALACLPEQTCPSSPVILENSDEGRIYSESPAQRNNPLSM